MSIASVVTEGYGSGASIARVVTSGYSSSTSHALAIGAGAFGVGGQNLLLKYVQQGPPAQSDMVAWYRGDSLNDDGLGNADSWTDKTGNGKTLNPPASFNRPTIAANARGARSAARFYAPWQHQLLTTDITKAQPLTVVAYVKSTRDLSSGSDVGAFFDGWNGGATFCSAFYAAPTNRLSSYAGGPTAMDTTVVGGDWTLVQVDFNGASTVVWADGVSAATGNSNVVNGLVGLSVGKGQFSTSQYFGGDIAEVIVYNKVLDSTERGELQDYFENYYLAGSSMAVEAGAFSLAGQSAGLNRGRRVTADAAAFSLAGQGISLKSGKRLAANKADFALGANQVGLLKANRIAVGRADYALAGRNVGLTTGTSNYSLGVGVGQFSLLGGQVSLRGARRMSAAAAAFAYSAQSIADRTRHLSMTASPYAMTIARQGVELYRYRIKAEPAGYTVVRRWAAMTNYGSKPHVRVRTQMRSHFAITSAPPWVNDDTAKKYSY